MNSEQNNIAQAHKHPGVTGHSVKDFLPLIVMVSIVLGLTLVGVVYLEQDLMLAFMGYFFLVFGLLKVIRLRGFVSAYRMYDVLAMRSKTYAYIYPFIELSFAAAYLLVWQVKIVSGVVVVVMLIGAYGVYRKLRQREEVPCACLGTVFKIPMTYVTLGEDLLMAAMALMVIFFW